MEEKEVINIRYQCKNFYCRNSPNSVTAIVSVAKVNFERDDVCSPKCIICEGEMISAIEEEISNTMWSAGIKY